MPSIRSAFRSLAPLLLLGVGACAAPGFHADVARFQAMPAPQGQTFVVEASDPKKRGGIEFGQYARIVGQEMISHGYQPAADPRGASFVIMLDYGVDTGQEKVVSYPGFGGGFGPYGYGGFGYGGFGRGRFGGWGYGWNDPWLYGGGTDVESFTLYTSYIDMQINRAATGERLFEGKAKARSRDDSLPHLVPNLIEAIFTGFPGQSGEDVKITIPPAPRVTQR